ncbi:substrate-specific component BL0695 of predicted ECF transporter [Cutibacterium acnes JCM 18918]|nr:substrate-specific component BL0695 of predicted ECF transporter [Cutibacterium acnes JCM 18918]
MLGFIADLVTTNAGRNVRLDPRRASLAMRYSPFGWLRH